MPTANFSSGTKRFTKNELVEDQEPGPGAYLPLDLNDSQRLDYAVTSVFKSSSTGGGFFQNTPLSPGPGEYKDVYLKHMVPRSPTYHITGKAEVRDRDETASPGPGHYRPQNYSPKNAKALKWMPDYKEEHDHPGPKQDCRRCYQYGKEAAPKMNVTTFNQNPMYNNAPMYTMRPATKHGSTFTDYSDSPSPAAYTVQLPRSQIAKSISMKNLVVSDKNVNNDAKDVPGPGTYMTPDSTIGSAYPVSKFRSRTPNNRTLSKAASTPTLKQSPAFSFSRSACAGSANGEDAQMFDTVDSLRGPGHYNVQKEAALAMVKRYHSGPAYSLTRRPEKTAITFGMGGSPGPIYYPEHTANSPKAVMGTSTRATKERSFSPGPGAYNHQPAYQYAAAARSTHKNQQAGKTIHRKIVAKASEEDPRNVGLVHHAQTRVLRKSAPAFSMAKKKKQREEFNGPGPGQYSQYTVFKSKKNYRL